MDLGNGDLEPWGHLPAMRYTYSAEVVRWVDGDTVDVVIDLGFKVSLRERLRLLGVDTPERGQEGYVEATEFCEKLAPAGSRVGVVTFKAGKYGRWLANIILDGTTETINDRLLSEGLAKEYPS